jgi:hypothetical protein
MAVLAQRSALRAVGAHVDRRIEHRLLADPHVVPDDCIDRAPDGTVRADGAAHLDRPVTGGFGRLRLLASDQIQRQLADQPARANRQSGALQERSAIDGAHRRQRLRQPRLADGAV